MACEPKERTKLVITHDDEPYRDIHGNEVELGHKLRFLDGDGTAEVVLWNDDIYLDFGNEERWLFSFYVWMHDEYEVVG